jgi:hypothetical protein
VVLDTEGHGEHSGRATTGRFAGPRQCEGKVDPMSDPRGGNPFRQLQSLGELLEEHASLDGDVLEIRTDIWALHGVFPFAGQVLMAQFETYDEAKYVLDQVRGGIHPTIPF